MTPERWQQVKQRLEEALELDEPARAAFLDSVCANDPDLRAELESLLAAHAAAEGHYETPLIEADPMIGRSLGAYRVLRRLGAGGMGAVYLAARADDQFRRIAAIKLIRAELFDERTRRRFENERHTLAALEHPNIVKLLDGGATEDGIPYVVMDYVEGQSIDRYVKDRNLTVRERLALFRALCGAVHYAHQNLVVHRDLKPANILVTPQGVPKLLDFGIAKLLRPEYAASQQGYTRTAMQPMTPEFASPEQILGQPVTTASDIYSLGVLLYVLLVGEHPFQARTSSSYELERAICETEAQRPSAAAARKAARELRGDLDAIVMTAMRKEPQRRYSSAEHLSEDVRRYLAGEPVAARGDSWLYRGRKFLVRHRVAVPATAVAVGLLAGLALRDHADRLRLELLSESAIEGYLKLADLQGNRFRDNRGQLAQARQSVGQALALAEELARQNPKSARARTLLSRCHEKYGDVLAAPADRPAALDHYRKALALGDSDVARNARIWSKVAQIQSDANDPTAALESYRTIERLAADWQARAPDDASARIVLAFARELIAWFALLAGEAPANSEEIFRDAIRQYEAAAGARPTPGARRNLAKAYKSLAEAHKRMGRLDDALSECRRSRDESEALLRDAPESDQHATDVAQAEVLLVDVLVRKGSAPEARAETARALARLKPWIGRQSTTYLIDYVTILVGTPFPELADPAATLPLAREAADRMNGADPETLDLLAQACARAGNAAEAIATEQKALDLLPPQMAGRPVPEMRAQLTARLQQFQAKAAGQHQASQ